MMFSKRERKNHIIPEKKASQTARRETGALRNGTKTKEMMEFRGEGRGKGRKEGREEDEKNSISAPRKVLRNI